MKAAIIYSKSNHLNPGMLSVELALVQRLKSFNFDLIKFFSIESGFQRDDKDNIAYGDLSDAEQLEGFDVIVFCGDFLHWKRYLTRDILGRKSFTNPDLSTEDIINKWYSLVLLENKPTLQKRTIIIGGTFYGLNSFELTDARYLDALTALYSNALLVKMRDVFSANFVNQLTQLPKNYLGCDCALLMNADFIQLSPEDKPKDSYILYAFERSEHNFALRYFAKIISTLAKKDSIEIRWLGDSEEDLYRKIALVRNASMVLTDIYHLSVTAVREKVPTLCFGDGVSGPDTSITDKKKEIFFRQAFAVSHYIYSENVISAFESDKLLLKMGQDLLEILGNNEANAFIFNMLEQYREAVINEFDSAIRQLVM